MSNILDAIQVSGASYDLKDKNAPSVSSLTQSEYDNLPSTAKTSNTFFVITDAQAGDLTQYWTSAQTQSAITEATSGKASQSDLETVSGQVANKQDLLVSGTNIKTINNESILGSGNIDIQGGGGGKAIEAGRGIAITTGETADTINCTLPISASSEGIYTTSSYPFSSSSRKTGNVVFGYYNRLDTFGSYNHSNYNTFFGSNNYIDIRGDNMFIAGDSNKTGYPANTELSNIVLFGFYNKSSNPYETAFGRYNVSQYSSNNFGNSGNTLFSVGNGTADNARHNAFEIRQNGDIYLSSGGTDIKLQDHLGGGGASYSAGTGIDITNNVISVSGVVETSSITTAITSSSTDAQVPSAKAVNDKLGGLSLVKLSQAEYDALATKDNSTLYVIVN